MSTVEPSNGADQPPGAAGKAQQPPELGCCSKGLLYLHLAMPAWSGLQSVRPGAVIQRLCCAVTCLAALRGLHSSDHCCCWYVLQQRMLAPKGNPGMSRHHCRRRCWRPPINVRMAAVAVQRQLAAQQHHSTSTRGTDLQLLIAWCSWQ